MRLKRSFQFHEKRINILSFSLVLLSRRINVYLFFKVALIRLYRVNKF